MILACVSTLIVYPCKCRHDTEFEVKHKKKIILGVSPIYHQTGTNTWNTVIPPGGLSFQTGFVGFELMEDIFCCCSDNIKSSPATKWRA